MTMASVLDRQFGLVGLHDERGEELGPVHVKVRGPCDCSCWIGDRGLIE
jgi:hypothetical protein